MWLAINLGILSGLNIIGVFIIHWCVITTIGPGIETDALFAGLSVPQIVLAVISGSLIHVLVPLFAGEGEQRLRQDAWGFFILIGGLFGILTLLLFLLAPFWVPLLVPGFSEEGKALTVVLTRIQLISMIFSACSGVLWAIYHARRRFIWAELTPLLGTITSLGLLFWALPRYGIMVAAWAMVLRVAVQTLLLLPGLGGYRRPDWSSTAMKEAWRRLKPLLVGNVLFKTDSLVHNFLSSLAPAGGLSLLYFGQRIHQAGVQIVTKAIATPMVPLLAVHAKEGDWQKYRRIYRNRLFWITGLTSGGYLLFLMVGKHLLMLLVGYGNITKQNILLLWWIMVAFGGLGIGGPMGSILATSFYAKGNTSTPIKAGVITYFLCVGLKIVGFIKFGVVGIAIGTTVNFMLDILVMYMLLERELRIGRSCMRGARRGSPSSTLPRE